MKKSASDRWLAFKASWFVVRDLYATVFREQSSLAAKVVLHRNEIETVLKNIAFRSPKDLADSYGFAFDTAVSLHKVACLVVGIPVDEWKKHAFNFRTRRAVVETS